MKLYLIKSTLIILMLLSLGIVGCLKDKDFDNGVIQSVHTTGSQKIIELKITANNVSNFLVRAYDNSDNDTTINLVPVNLASADPAAEDINVTLELTPVLVDDLNALNDSLNNANGSSLITDYAVPDPSMYTMVNQGNIVTIPKGSNMAYLQMKFKPSAFIGGNWVFPFVIKSVDKPGYTISGNANNAMAVILIKNQYDGVYHSVGYFQHPSAPRAIDQEVDVITAGATSVTTDLGDLGPATTITITVNPDNTITQLVPGGTSNPTTALDLTYPNRYDPDTKTFYLKYGYPTPGPTRIITDTLIYEGPR